MSRGPAVAFTLIVWAGPVAILQASIVSIATFLVIFWVARRLGLDQRLAATLGGRRRGVRRLRLDRHRRRGRRQERAMRRSPSRW